MSLVSYTSQRMLAAPQRAMQLAGATLWSALTAPCCAACDATVATHVAFCTTCAATILADEPASWRLHDDPAVVAYGYYGGALADALVRFKYRDRPDLARPLGDLLRSRLRGGNAFTTPSARAWRSALDRCDAVVPVPLHPRRLAQRRYNQAALLARPCSRELGVPLLFGALRRAVDTRPQAQLDAAARRNNVRRAFHVAKQQLVRGKALLLIDDVCTTGATLAACDEALRAAGAHSIAALVVARRLEPSAQTQPTSF